MKKISILHSFLILILLAATHESLAQTANTVSIEATPEINPNPKLPPLTPEKKLSAVGKPLENSALVDEIQGGMANLLMGNKSISLMFDDRENDNIQRAIDSYNNKQSYLPDGSEESVSDSNSKEARLKREADAAARAKKEQDDFNEKSYIYLASIMYSTPHDWVVWVNDKKITSSSNNRNKEIFVKSVEKDRVSILWNVSPSKLKVLLGSKADSLKLRTNDAGQIEVKFALQPNQTFMLGSNTVVEGRLMTNMLKKKVETDPSAVDSLAPEPEKVSKYKTRVNQ